MRLLHAVAGKLKSSNFLATIACRNKPVYIVRFWRTSHGRMFLSHPVNAPLHLTRHKWSTSKLRWRAKVTMWTSSGYIYCVCSLDIYILWFSYSFEIKARYARVFKIVILNISSGYSHCCYFVVYIDVVFLWSAAKTETIDTTQQWSWL